MKKNLLILLGVIMLVGLGYWFFTQDWRGNDNAKYINSKHSYSFQYSPDWNLMGDSQADIVMLYNTEDPPGDGGVPVGIKMDIMALENYDDLSLSDWVEQISQNGPEEEILQQENIKISGFDAIRKIVEPIFTELNEGSPISIYFAKDNYIFIISYLGSEPDYSEQMGNFELILNTLNFN
ncbi:hypothetical protein KJ641_04155 [Patescibacteria group bacterium]|nr:hypothetical protein [Patescibacteria group bacterium]MBU1896033.1 hypothetical protein [Patescibacteria group bacterium]